jgi:hypothetical protein
MPASLFLNACRLSSGLSVDIRSALILHDDHREVVQASIRTGRLEVTT